MCASLALLSATFTIVAFVVARCRDQSSACTLGTENAQWRGRSFVPPVERQSPVIHDVVIRPHQAVAPLVLHLQELMTKLLRSLAALLLFAVGATAFASGNGLVISQLYGGGGNNGATYKNDFIEIFNAGSQSISLTGLSVQYASATGTSWQVTPLSGTVQPGQYYLIQEQAGAGGTVNLPTPDVTGTGQGIAMSATAGKVALVNSTTALTGAAPTVGVIDIVSFGAATPTEGSPTPTLSCVNT